MEFIAKFIQKNWEWILMGLAVGGVCSAMVIALTPSLAIRTIAVVGIFIAVTGSGILLENKIRKNFKAEIELVVITAQKPLVKNFSTRKKI